jgi:hypothetical protein
MHGDSYEVVAIYPTIESNETIRVVSDASGVLALIKAEPRYAGNYFDDPDDRAEGWYSYSVEWSRSGTIYPGGLRSNNLEATCAGVARWEGKRVPARVALIEDYRMAVERAELASAEFERLDDSVERERAGARVREALAKKQQLGMRLRNELEADGAIPAAGESYTRIESEALDVVCRQSVLTEAANVLNRSGVLITIRDDLLSSVAAKLNVPLRDVCALWPSFEAMEAEVLMTLAKEGLSSRADDPTLITAWHYITRHVDDLRTTEGRAALLRELITLVSAHNFENVTASMTWRNYVTCATAIARTPALSESLTEELQIAEEAFLDRMGEFYRNMLGLIGYRLRSDLRDDFRAFALILASGIEGLGLVRRSVRTVIGAQYGPHGSGAVSVATLLVSSLVNSMIEPDPGYDAEVAIDQVTNGLTLTSD